MMMMSHPPPPPFFFGGVGKGGVLVFFTNNFSSSHLRGKMAELRGMWRQQVIIILFLVNMALNNIINTMSINVISKKYLIIMGGLEFVLIRDVRMRERLGRVVEGIFFNNNAI